MRFFLARGNERDERFWPMHRQTGVAGDYDGGGRTAFRVGQHGSRFWGYVQEGKIIAHTHSEY